MARTLIATVTADNASLVPTAGDATNHHYFVWSPHRILIMRNADASSKTPTIDTPGTVAGNAIANYAPVVAAGAIVKIDTRDPAYRQPLTGWVHVDLSAATSVTLGVLDVG